MQYPLTLDRKLTNDSASPYIDILRIIVSLLIKNILAFPENPIEANDFSFITIITTASRYVAAIMYTVTSNKTGHISILQSGQKTSIPYGTHMHSRKPRSTS